MIRIGDSNRFSFGVENTDSNYASNAKNRVADRFGCCFRVLSFIAALISKYISIVVTKLLKEMNGDPACPRIWWEKSLAMKALRCGRLLIETGTRVRMVASLAPTAVN